MSNNEVYLEINDSIATLVVDRPNVFNALDTKILYRINDLLNEVERNDKIRVLAITGSGEKSFIAGANINDLRKMTPETARNSIVVGHRVFQRIEDIPKPTIAVINGHCLGGGLELAMCCDIRICRKNIKIGLTEANVGMIPGWGGTLRLQRIVGQGRAKQMILLGLGLSPEVAKDFGLIMDVYDTVEELREAGNKLARKLSRFAPHVMALDKRMIAESYNAEVGYTTLQDSLALAYCFTTEDSIEGLSAFLEKRNPDFKGK